MSKKRTPNGAVSKRPIALRLPPELRKEVEQLSEEHGRSMANLCFLFVAQGVKACKQQAPARPA